MAKPALSARPRVQRSRIRHAVCLITFGLLLLTGCETQPEQPTSLPSDCQLAKHGGCRTAAAQHLRARIRRTPHVVAASQQNAPSQTDKDVGAIMEGIARARASSRPAPTQSNPGP